MVSLIKNSVREYFMSSEVLEELLQLAVLSTGAVGGAVFRIAPESKQLTATIQHGTGYSLDSALRALTEEQIIREQHGETLQLYAPISQDGVLGLVFEQEEITETQQQLMKL